MKNKINLSQIKIITCGMVVFIITTVSGCGNMLQSSGNSNSVTAVTNVSKPAESPKTTASVEVSETNSKDKIVKTESDSKRNVSTNEKTTVKISKENFDKINVGMSYKEVAELLNDKGMKTSDMTVNGRVTEMYMWANDDFSKYINVEFEKEKVIAKKEKGL